MYAQGALEADRECADRLFDGEEAVLHVIERIVAPLGLRVDATSPWVDARLPDRGCRPNPLAPLLRTPTRPPTNLAT
jgi:Flp pilus assembly CpaF family ATPase